MKSATIPPTVYLDATSASRDTARANLFNQYFYSVFTQPNVTDDHVNSISHPGETDSLVFNEDKVYSALSQLDSNKATGLDTISLKILKHCASSPRPL